LYQPNTSEQAYDKAVRRALIEGQSLCFRGVVREAVSLNSTHVKVTVLFEGGLHGCVKEVFDKVMSKNSRMFTVVSTSRINEVQHITLKVDEGNLYDMLLFGEDRYFPKGFLI
jgi:hypothetical protein